jgi:hypothetical protein
MGSKVVLPNLIDLFSSGFGLRRFEVFVSALIAFLFDIYEYKYCCCIACKALEVDIVQMMRNSTFANYNQVVILTSITYFELLAMWPSLQLARPNLNLLPHNKNCSSRPRIAFYFNWIAILLVEEHGLVMKPIAPTEDDIIVQSSDIDDFDYEEVLKYLEEEENGIESNASDSEEDDVSEDEIEQEMQVL